MHLSHADLRHDDRTALYTRACLAIYAVSWVLIVLFAFTNNLSRQAPQAVVDRQNVVLGLTAAFNIGLSSILLTRRRVGAALFFSVVMALIALTSAGVAVSDGFGSPWFVFYYPLALLTALVAAPTANLLLTSATTITYLFISLYIGSGVTANENDWVVLSGRILALWTMSLVAMLLSHRERRSRVLAEQSDERYRRERETRSAILESMAEGVLVVDSSKRIVYFNKGLQHLFRTPLDQFFGQDVAHFWDSVITIEDNLTEKESLARSLRSIPQARTSLEITDLRTGKRLSINVFPIQPVPGDELTGFLVRDITGQRELERHRDAFVSVASHELRIPMSIIMGFSELLLMRNPPEATRRDWIERIYQNSQVLSNIVDDLLNVSLIHSGKLTIKAVPVDLPQVVNRALELVRHISNKHELVVDLDPNIPRVMADPEKLRQVLTNLLDNAVKYSPNGGHITVSARHEPEQRRVVVNISDEGIGIANEDVETLFTPFHRIRRPETEGVRGTGLGLYIVKSLVELMKGEVKVESTLGKGSTFSFMLPTPQEAKTGEAA